MNTILDPFGRPITTPVLQDNGIVIEEFVVSYDSNVESEATTRPIRSSYLFDISGARPFPSDEKHGPAFLIPATTRNLLSFLNLPFIDPGQRTKATELWLQWTINIPTACFRVMVDKNSTVPDEEAPGYRKLVHHEKVVDKVVEPLTPGEQMGQMMGMKVRSEEERTKVVEKQVEVPHPAYWLQQFSPRRLYSQQIIGAAAILEATRLGVFYDMRVGKTQTAITAARAAIAEGRADYIIVVAPKGNLYDPWFPELQKNGLDVAVLDGDSYEDEVSISNLDHNHAPYHEREGRPLALLVNYERVGLRWSTMVDYLRLERAFIILDETSAIKNPGANRSKAAHTLCERAAFVVLLNGTPMEQGPQDLWSQLKCLDPHGSVIGSEFWAFAKRFLEEVTPGKWRVSGLPEIRRAFDIMLSTLSIRYIRGEADQFAGKDKTFRYIAIRPTKQMIDQTLNVEAGFIKTMDNAGEMKAQEISSCVLAVYGFLREICCGYDKYRDEDTEGEYRRVRHPLDPKLLWVRAFIEANPTEPLVLYCNFNEQEQALKEMLDRMGVKWSATKPKCKVIQKRRITDTISRRCVEYLMTRYPGRNLRFDSTGTTGYTGYGSGGYEELFNVPAWLHWDSEITNDLYQHRDFYRYTTTEPVYQEQSFSAQERAEQVAKFNSGEVHCFILKVKQGRGISLNRREAVENNIGTYPTMVFLSPPWSLGDWEQAQDRCVGVDPTTGKNINTLIYALSVKGSIEDKILKALRAKKEVATELMDDAKREGFTSFVSGLIDSMREAMMEGGDGVFDSEEMYARIACGVPPASKLTESFILNRMIEKLGREYGWKSKPQALAWLAKQPRKDLEYSEDGVLLNPDSLVVEAAFLLLERTPGWTGIKETKTPRESTSMELYYDNK